MAVQIQIRRGTSSEWTSANPTLADGELGLETDTSKIKIGNGSTAWASLGYQVGDITAVTAGTGLSGGGETGSVTLSIDTATVATLSDTQTLSNKTLTSVKKVDFDPAAITADLKSINVTTAVLVDSFTSDSYRSAEYLLQLTQGSNYAITKILVIHDGTDVAVSEYGYVNVGAPIDYVLSGSFSTGNLELTITCSTANVTPVALKFSRILFDT